MQRARTHNPSSFVSISAVLIAFLPVTLVAEQTASPSKVEAVRQHILGSDYPELFGDNSYETQVVNVVVADFDNDGSSDVIVHFTPHFRQSAPIILYNVSDDLEVTRVVEGIAPGLLQEFSGELLDSHPLGMAVDFSIPGEESNSSAHKKMINSGISSFGGFVAYRDFFHADSRDGSSYFIDMTHILDIPDSRTCESFEFSQVRQLAVGPLAGESENYLAAWVGDEIWIYRIESVSDDGLLEKNIWIQDAPHGFTGFAPGAGLTLSTEMGESFVLALEEQKQSD